MAVDRAARDQLVEMMLGFMRSEFTMEEAWNRYHLICKSRSRDARGVAQDSATAPLPLLMRHMKTEDHFIAASRDQWDETLRYLAFMRSDLELETVRVPLAKRERRVGIAIGSMAIFVVGMYAWLGWSWQFALFGWAGCYWLSVVFGNLNIRAGSSRREFYPFNDEAQWSAYRGLLSDMDIPKYDPAKHDRRVPRQRMNWREKLAVAVCVPLVLVLFLIAPTILGPFGLALHSVEGLSRQPLSHERGTIH